ncbi:hypothetical protein EC973_008219 [Apophysomyces ossiformis]|uniref:RAD50-interacting protein 1 n=1 Tax=Apophysomyces ossiformis TaxID=679940 RepID=A0A8H7EP97_9FUNG|nr:hypothetical protein EC973_008219 [Apophysomyces ossiformis]
MASFQQTIETYLNANIPALGENEIVNLNSLLESRQSRQADLDKKLDTVKEKTQQALKTMLDTVHSEQKLLEETRTSLIQKENEICQYCPSHAEDQNTSDDTLLKRLGSLEARIRTIDHTKDYVKTLLVCANLSEEALAIVQSDPEAAIKPYNKLGTLRRFVENHSKSSHGHADLLTHLTNCHTYLWEQLNAALTRNFKSSLDALSWPNPIKPPYGPQLRDKLDHFEQCFRNLLLLHKPSGKIADEHKNRVLVPVALMLEPISLRFRFHFESNKPTNRLDKPEWYLKHIKNTITTHMPFLITTIQPILDGVSDYLGAKLLIKDNFIQGLLANVSRKLNATLPKLLNHANWLSHTTHEVLLFDQSLQEEFAYAVSGPQRSNSPIGEIILGNDTWFNAWFEAEKKFSIIRYDEIVLDSQAFDVYIEDELQRDSKEAGGGDAKHVSTMKRTRSAVHLLSLLEGITETYKPVPSLVQRLKFFAEIQLSLLDRYHQRISSAVDSFEALSLLRSVPVPGSFPDAVTGLKTANDSAGSLASLGRLCRWWASIRTIGEAIRYMVEDDHFLSMQYEVDARPDVVMEAGVEEIFLPVAKDSQSFSLFSRVLMDCEALTERIEKILEIEDWYWRYVITQNQFSKQGSLQLEVDLQLGLWKTGKQWVRKPENYTKRLKETLKLLTLSFNATNGEATSELHTFLPYDEFMKALMDASEKARIQKELDRLGIELLSYSQVRDVLRRRSDMLCSWS